MVKGKQAKFRKAKYKELGSIDSRRIKLMQSLCEKNKEKMFKGFIDLSTVEMYSRLLRIDGKMFELRHFWSRFAAKCNDKFGFSLNKS